MTPPSPTRLSAAALKKNQELILGEFEHEMETSIDYLDGHMRQRFWGPLGIVVRRVAKELFQWFIRMGGKDLGRKMFEGVIEQATHVGERSLDEVAEKGFSDYRKHNMLAHRVNRDHPAYPQFEKALKEEHRATLDLYARIVRGKGEDYPTLVRDAFPKRAELDRHVRARLEASGAILDLIEAEEGLLKIPGMIRRPVLQIVRTGFDAVQERILASVDDIYTGTPAKKPRRPA